MKFPIFFLLVLLFHIYLSARLYKQQQQQQEQKVINIIFQSYKKVPY